MAANYAKIRDGGKGAGLHYRTFEGFSKLVALKLRKLRREDFPIAIRIREVGLKPRQERLRPYLRAIGDPFMFDTIGYGRS